ncbi:MAG: NAD-dependent DNA ligase LigA [Oscillospiraceae bacterium]|nr:NAD-dependent DNA ligase LigA [Oscillospiraceae bacterium]
MSQIVETMQELVSQLVVADIAYYKRDDPIMSDREYDALYERLAELERSSGIVLSGSPTQKTSGEVLEGLVQVRHTKPMLSAQKTKSPDEVVRFIGGRGAVVSWKLDGLTLVLRYDGGRLVQALTRGGEGGMIGEDVTHSARVMANVPLSIPHTEPFEVRGEGIISWENFNRVNAASEEPYSHPRNLAAGSIRRLDAGKTKEQMLEFIAFEIVDGGPPSKTGQFDMLNENGFSVVQSRAVPEGADSACIFETLALFDPKSFQYPVDGLIIEYDDLAYGQSLGATGHHENRLIALKWEDELFETTFLGLELSTTRTGMVSLTGIFEDTVIDGATVNRAYLHNLDVMDRFSLGIGDRVKIYRANQIIPQLAENITKSGTLSYPTQCPCCKSELAIKTSDSGTRLLYCENLSCPARLIRKFVHFCSKTRMDIPDLSEKRLEVFIGKGWIKNYGDLYELKQYREQFIAVPGFGEKLFDRITSTIESRRRCTLSQFIAGLGIPMVGRSSGRILDAYFSGDWDAFEQAIVNGFDFTQLKDFGQTMNDNIYAWYSDQEEEKLWRPLLKHITFIINEINDDSAQIANPFSGKTVVATGKLINYTRDGIQAKLLSLGANPASSVSKNTDFLIVGENAGSKLDKARQFSVRILDEAEFDAMLADFSRTGSL